MLRQFPRHLEKGSKKKRLFSTRVYPAKTRKEKTLTWIGGVEETEELGRKSLPYGHHRPGTQQPLYGGHEKGDRVLIKNRSFITVDGSKETVFRNQL